MNWPPPTPAEIRAKATAWLKIGHVGFADSALRYCIRQNGPSQKYICEQLLAHFESGRAVYRKHKDDRHVVMQGQKWDRSDFFMLLPEAGTFGSPRTPAAASGAGFGGA